MALPAEIVSKFDGKLMNIVGYGEWTGRASFLSKVPAWPAFTREHSFHITQPNGRWYKWLMQLTRSTSPDGPPSFRRIRYCEECLWRRG